MYGESYFSSSAHSCIVQNVTAATVEALLLAVLMGACHFIYDRAPTLWAKLASYWSNSVVSTQHGSLAVPYGQCRIAKLGSESGQAIVLAC
jgi:hypothetical protein